LDEDIITYNLVAVIGIRSYWSVPVSWFAIRLHICIIVKSVIFDNS